MAANNRLKRGVKYVMYVQGASFKKTINKQTGPHWLFNVSLIDSNETKYITEYASPVQTNQAFIPGNTVCFEVEFSNNFTDEIVPAKHDETALVYGISPDFQGLPQNANNSISHSMPQVDVTIPCDNIDLAFQIAGNIFSARILSGQIMYQNELDLSDLGAMALNINRQICNMKEKFKNK